MGVKLLRLAQRLRWGDACCKHMGQLLLNPLKELGKCLLT